MKLKNILLLLGLCSSSLMLTSCEDFLTQHSQTGVSTGTFYEDLDDCTTGLVSVYNGMIQLNNFALTDENLRSDLCISGNVSRTKSTSTSYLQTFNDVTTAALNKWAALYEGVLRANLLLEGLDKALPNISESELETWELIQAEGYFFRGLFHFWLHNSFNNGSVPIFDFVPSTNDEYFQPLTPADEVLAFYRSDLEKAIEIGLAEEWTSSSDLGRITQYTALAVLGKSYLYTGEYEKAAECFAEIIESGKFSLAGVGDNITTQGEFNSESLLECSYTFDFNTNQTGDAKLYHTWGMNTAETGGWSTIVPAFWLVEQAEGELVDPYKADNWREVSLDDDGDIIYTQKGFTYTKETVSSGVTTRATYVNPRGDIAFNSDGTISNPDDLIDVLNIAEGVEMDYYYKIYTKTETIAADGTRTSVTYASANTCNDQDYFTVRKNAGIYERLRLYSPRASYSFVIQGDESLLYYGDISSATKFSSNGDTAYFRKLSNWDLDIAGESSNTVANGSAVNLRLIRLADVYMMYAECLIKGGTDDSNLKDAITYVNKVRNRAGTILIGNASDGEFNGSAMYYSDFKAAFDARVAEEQAETEAAGGTYVIEEISPFAEALNITTAAELMEHLMYVERPLELNVEGHAIRVCDMRRWGITAARFKELSQRYYWCQWSSHLICSDEGVFSSTTTTADQTILTDADSPNTIKSDFNEAAVNYTDAANAYWPIPSKEVSANPNL